MGERRSCIANEHGHRLHRWEQDGQEWACAAYDHSAFCRLCQPVTTDVRQLLGDVERGEVHVYANPDGSFYFAVVEGPST